MAITLSLLLTAPSRQMWPTTFIVVRCPHCHSKQIVKRGKTRRGTQRYLCQNTACTCVDFSRQAARQMVSDSQGLERSPRQQPARRRVRRRSLACPRSAERRDTVEQQEYDDLLRRLTVLVVKLDSPYAELVEGNRQQREFNRQQVEINQDVKTTLACIETLLAWMIPQSENGREV
jgi:InsA-like protein